MATKGARRGTPPGAAVTTKVSRREPQAGRGEAHKAKVSFTIDAIVSERINEFAAVNDVSASSVVNEALAKFLRREAMKKLVARNPPTRAMVKAIVDEWNEAGLKLEDG